MANTPAPSGISRLLQGLNTGLSAISGLGRDEDGALDAEAAATTDNSNSNSNFTKHANDIVIQEKVGDNVARQ